MNKESLIQSLKYGEATILDHEELKMLVKENPWFGAAHFALTKIAQKSGTLTSEELSNVWLRLPNPTQYCRVEAGEDIFIAMALLPPNIDVGTRLHYEMLSYTVI